jgi:hypothetical protein
MSSSGDQLRLVPAGASLARELGGKTAEQLGKQAKEQASSHKGLLNGVIDVVFADSDIGVGRQRTLVNLSSCCWSTSGRLSTTCSLDDNLRISEFHFERRSWWYDEGMTTAARSLDFCQRAMHASREQRRVGRAQRGGARAHAQVLRGGDERLVRRGLAAPEPAPANSLALPAGHHRMTRRRRPSC